MTEKQRTINPAPKRQYHSVCPKCKGALTMMPSGSSLCEKCAGSGGMLYLALTPADLRLSKRMVSNAAYPVATPIGMLLNKDEAIKAGCRREDVCAIDGLSGLYVRLTPAETVTSTKSTVWAKTADYRRRVFVRWDTPQALLDAIDRELHPPPGDEGDDTSPEYKDRRTDALSSGETPSA